MNALTPLKIELKRATGEVIAGVDGVEAAASRCRVGKSVLSENQSVHRGESFIAIDVLADLEPLSRARAGWPAVTRILCRANGGAFVELPDPQDPSGDIHGAAAAHAKESSEITARLFAAARDGKLTREAIRKHELIREAREAVEASVQLLAHLEAIDGGE